MLLVTKIKYLTGKLLYSLKLLIQKMLNFLVCLQALVEHLLVDHYNAPSSFNLIFKTFLGLLFTPIG